MKIEDYDIDRLFEGHDVMETFFNNSGLNGAFDNKGHAVHLSQSWTDELGWTLDEIKAMSFFDLIHPDDMDKSIEAYKTNDHFLENHPFGFMNRYRCKDESYIWIYWKPWIFDINGLKLASGEVFRDETIANAIEQNIKNGRII